MAVCGYQSLLFIPQNRINKAANESKKRQNIRGTVSSGRRWSARCAAQFLRPGKGTGHREGKRTSVAEPGEGGVKRPANSACAHKCASCFSFNARGNPGTPALLH